MAAAFLLVPALPASAHIQAFTVIGGFASAPAPDQVDWQSVGGTIDCTEGEKFLVTAKVIDDSYAGKGWTRGTCFGEPQGWQVTLTSESGTGDGCFERMAAKAHTKINGVPHDEAVDVAAPNCA